MRKVWPPIALLVVLGIFMLSDFEKEQLHLIIQEQRTNQEFKVFSVGKDDIIEVHWIHSVELTPWIEVYQTTENLQLALIETKFQSYGAGVPNQLEGTVSYRDGFTILSNLNQTIEKFQWMHSHDAEFKIIINGETVIYPRDLPHHTPMQFYVEKR